MSRHTETSTTQIERLLYNCLVSGRENLFLCTSPCFCSLEVRLRGQITVWGHFFVYESRLPRSDSFHPACAADACQPTGVLVGRVNA